MPCLRSSWARARRRQPLVRLLRADQHLGVRLVVDESDLGHPVEHLGRDLVVAPALAQLPLELGSAARSHAQLPQDDGTRDGLGVSIGDERLGVVRRRRPVGPLPRIVRAPSGPRLPTPTDLADLAECWPSWTVGTSRAALAHRDSPGRAVGPHPGNTLGLSQGGRGAGQTVLRGLRFGGTHDQKSTGTSETSAGWSTRGPTPSFSLIFFSISSARSGLSLRKLRAFSLPWPSWSPS